MVTVKPSTETRFWNTKNEYMADNKKAIFSNSQFLELLLDVYDKNTGGEKASA